MAQKINLNPSIVKIIIIVTIGLIIFANVGVFFLGKNLISDNAKGITEVTSELKKTQQELEAIEVIRSQMKKLDDIPELVNEALVDVKDNHHQEKIIATIEHYASNSHLTIASIDFPTPKSKGKKEITASVTFRSPANYNDFLNFMKLIEAGLPRMQITDLSISKALANRADKDKKGSPDDVNISSVQLKIFTK